MWNYDSLTCTEVIVAEGCCDRNGRSDSKFNNHFKLFTVQNMRYISFNIQS